MQAVWQLGCQRGTHLGDNREKGSRKKLKKLLKNLLTNARGCDIILGHFRSGWKAVEKVFKKTFEKPLDKRKEMWYNNQVAKNAAMRTQVRADH